jgi:DNA (cytosine-5)-methyltransferase 1
MKKVYYNDNDKGSCAWLKQLIKDGLIPDGDVDDRSILEVKGDDVRGYTQAHFFAGIGGWVHALALSGWPGDRRIWTGSCPCQPFSCAGKGQGEKDKRHLWPEFRRLIKECRPPEVFGEQVAAKAGRLWLSGVRADLEEMGYAVGASDLCAAGVGSPHIRQRLYWCARHDGLANSEHDGRRSDLEGRGQEGRASDGGSGEAARGRRDAEQRIEDGGLADSSGERVRACGHGSGDEAQRGTKGSGTERERVRSDAGNGVDAGGVADSDRERRVGEHSLLRQEGQERGSKEVPEASRGSEDGGMANSERPERGTDDERGRIHGGREEDPSRPRSGGEDCGMANSEGAGGRAERGAMEGVPRQEPEGEQQRGTSRTESASGSATRRFTNWDDFKWHECQDGRKRRIPTEPAFFPMANGIPSGRVGLLRGAGNAICPPLAAEFIKAVMECS